MQVERQETTLRAPTSKAECRTLSLMCMFFLWVGNGGFRPLQGQKRGHPLPLLLGVEFLSLLVLTAPWDKMEPLSAPPGLLHPQLAAPLPGLQAVWVCLPRALEERTALPSSGLGPTHRGC